MFERKEKCILIVISVVLIAASLFLENKSDLVGFSNFELNMIESVNVISNIIISIGIIIAVLVNKVFPVIFLLIFRSMISCIPICIYAKESESLNVINFFIIVFSVAYVLVLILYWKYKASLSIAILITVLCRVIIIVLNGSIFDVIYGLQYENTYFIGNILYLLSTELIFILPLLFWNKKDILCAKSAE